MSDCDKRSVCHHGKYCAKQSCDDCTPALPPRSKKCLHWLTNPGVCAYDGGPCCDGDFGNLCECFVDRTTRPSENHVFDLMNGEWILKKENVDNKSHVEMKPDDDFDMVEIVQQSEKYKKLSMKDDIRSCCCCIMNLLCDLKSVGKENKTAENWLKKTCNKYGFNEFLK